MKTCFLEAIVSLPNDAFYSTPKKTYIFVIRKKQAAGDKQDHPVFTYLITEVGETKDSKRFVIGENDLPKMSAAFRLFQGNPSKYSSDDPRCKVFSIERFKADEHWLVNKWWTREERETLGDLDEETFIGPSELGVILNETASTIAESAESVLAVKRSVPVHRTVTVSLDDLSLFRMAIGKRVLRKTLFYAAAGEIPLYSANVETGREHGWVNHSNLSDFSCPSLLWSIDSDFNMTVRKAGDMFATTDHCGRIEILDSGLDPEYCKAAIIYGVGRLIGFDRVTRPSLRRIKHVTFKVPVNESGTFDLEAQRDLAVEFTTIQTAVEDAAKSLESLVDLKPRAELPSDVIDLRARKHRKSIPKIPKDQSNTVSRIRCGVAAQDSTSFVAQKDRGPSRISSDYRNGRSCGPSLAYGVAGQAGSLVGCIA